MINGTPITINVVAGVIINRDGKYLLVQEKGPKARGLWNWPAGRVDEGFTIVQTAIKEAKEETGFDVELVREIGFWHESELAPVKHLFKAKIVRGELQFPEDEIMDARWWTVEEIQKLREKLRGKWILEGIEKAGSHG